VIYIHQGIDIDIYQGIASVCFYTIVFLKSSTYHIAQNFGLWQLSNQNMFGRENFSRLGYYTVERNQSKTKILVLGGLMIKFCPMQYMVEMFCYYHNTTAIK